MTKKSLIAAGIPEDKAEIFSGPIDQIFPMWDINTITRKAHIITQFIHESVSFTKLSENLYYKTPSRIVQVWPTRFTLQKASLYVRNPQGLANYVYGGRNGNGPPHSNHGWIYRGGGLIHVTFRDNYRKCTELVQAKGCDVDYVRDPNLVREDPFHAVMISCAWWEMNKMNREADKGNNIDAIKRVSGIVNTGSPNGIAHGLTDRIRTFYNVYPILSEPKPRVDASPVPDLSGHTLEEYIEDWHPPLKWEPPMPPKGEEGD